MDTYILLGCGFGFGLLIAIWGIWSLRQPSKPVLEEHAMKDEFPYQSVRS
jgi:hypothetical protein